jgi:alcohol dehydrogenase (cytochrome c)
MIKATSLALLLGSVVMANAQTADELKNDANTPSDVLVYGMGYAGNRYSPLTLIRWHLILARKH